MTTTLPSLALPKHLQREAIFRYASVIGTVKDVLGVHKHKKYDFERITHLAILYKENKITRDRFVEEWPADNISMMKVLNALEA